MSFVVQQQPFNTPKAVRICMLFPVETPLCCSRGLKQPPLQGPVSVTGPTALPMGLPSPAGLRVHSRRHRISVGYQVTTDQEGSGRMVRCRQGQMAITRTPAWAQHTQQRGLLQCSHSTSSKAPPRTSECGEARGEEGDKEKLVNDLELATT